MDEQMRVQDANEVFKDGYNLGGLGVTDPIAELELGAKAGGLTEA